MSLQKCPYCKGNRFIRIQYIGHPVPYSALKACQQCKGSGQIEIAEKEDAESFAAWLQETHKGYSFKIDAELSFTKEHRFEGNLFDAEGNNIATITTPNYDAVYDYFHKIIDLEGDSDND
jgi:DnaJ-class molecular chaperone